MDERHDIKQIRHKYEFQEFTKKIKKKIQRFLHEFLTKKINTSESLFIQ